MIQHYCKLEHNSLYDNSFRCKKSLFLIVILFVLFHYFSASHLTSWLMNPLLGWTFLAIFTCLIAFTKPRPRCFIWNNLKLVWACYEISNMIPGRRWQWLQICWCLHNSSPELCYHHHLPEHLQSSLQSVRMWSYNWWFYLDFYNEDGYLISWSTSSASCRPRYLMPASFSWSSSTSTFIWSGTASSGWAELMRWVMPRLFRYSTLLADNPLPTYSLSYTWERSSHGLQWFFTGKWYSLLRLPAKEQSKTCSLIPH